LLFIPYDNQLININFDNVSAFNYSMSNKSDYYFIRKKGN